MGRNELTVLGPAPMIIARPDGGILVVCRCRGSKSELMS